MGVRRMWNQLAEATFPSGGVPDDKPNAGKHIAGYITAFGVRTYQESCDADGTGEGREIHPDCFCGSGNQKSKALWFVANNGLFCMRNMDGWRHGIWDFGTDIRVNKRPVHGVRSIKDIISGSLWK